MNRRMNLPKTLRNGLIALGFTIPLVSSVALGSDRLANHSWTHGAALVMITDGAVALVIAVITFLCMIEEGDL